MFRAFKDFWQRRVYIPVDWNALVLDIGSGEKPHWRADVLCDYYPEEEYSLHRSGGGGAKVTAPLVEGSVEKLPFKDKAFDFVIASHLLEHIPDVGKACEEMMRVSKAGYIEVPDSGHAKIHDFESHLWYCYKQGRKMVFTPKQKVIYDTEIHQFAESLIDRKVWFEKVIHPNFDLVAIRFWWKDSFEYEVKGPVSKNLQEEIEKSHTETRHKTARNKVPVMRSLLMLWVKMMFWYRHRVEPFHLESILMCPDSKETDLIKVSEGVYKGRTSGEVIRVSEN